MSPSGFQAGSNVRKKGTFRHLTSSGGRSFFFAACRSVRAGFSHLNFIQLHYLYILATCLLSAVVLWATSTPTQSISFTDSLFLTTSAITEAGLNTVNLSTLNTFQQIMLFTLIIIGSSIFVSAFVIHVRKNAFDNRSLGKVELNGGWRKKYMSPDTTAKENETSHIDTERGRTMLRVQDASTDNTFQGNVSKDSSVTTQVNAGAQTTRKGALSPDTVSIATTQERITFSSDTRFSRQVVSESGQGYVLSHLLPRNGIGAAPNARPRSRSSHITPVVVEARARSNDQAHSDGQSAALNTGIAARNSTFHHMSEEDRERLIRLEYRAVRLLSYLVPAYLVAWQLFAVIGLGTYVQLNRPDTARKNGLNPFWVGAFNAVSAFNNSGMSLLDANMIAFQNSVYMLLSMSLFILAGNTCYPIFLRLICWTMWKLTPLEPRFQDFRATLRFLLDHPRRVYTNFFPARETWWLLACVIVLNGIDCAFFSILNIGNDAITRLSPGFEFLDGLFQATAVRSGGFYVVPIPSTRISLQVLYVVMMYIGVYPVVITMRNSNVYEERSLGIYADDSGHRDWEQQQQRGRNKQDRRGLLRTLLGHGPDKRGDVDGEVAANQKSRQGSTYMFVQQQLRAQLAHDLWWLVLAVWLISIVEGGSFERDPTSFSVFNIIFEVVSAYGTVGISVGVPDDAYSFCGSWHALSKLILCAVMVRGRHRGLPVAIDRAVMLPGDGRGMADMEEEDARLRWERAKKEEEEGKGELPRAEESV